MTHTVVEPADVIDGCSLPIHGDALVSTNPAQLDAIIWQGSPSITHVDLAVRAARQALPEWAARSMDERIAFLRRWQRIVNANIERIASLITAEMGKTLAESTFEANALAGKVDITLDSISMDRVREYEVAAGANRVGYCRYKPYGVMAVIGPFNFPAHLPNGQFVPALLMGNTVVFKPSEKTPAVGQLLGELMQETGLPAGVFNVVQGGPEIAARLTMHDDIDGILFTGSWPVGRRILEANLDRPGRMIALEMGGNNPSVVLDDANLKQAAIECVRAGFATTGQRCTCTRRIIVQRGIADRFISAFCKAASTLVIGPGDDADNPVFMGPLISDAAVEAVLDFQAELVASGSRLLMQATRMGDAGHFCTPGVVEADAFSLEHDREVFGPFVQIAIVESLEEAIEQANATQYGLSASIFTADERKFQRFFRNVRSGCINHNTGTAGASSKLPFGGVGHSGNNRPAAAFAVDLAAYPIASMIDASNDVALPNGMLWDDGWLK